VTVREADGVQLGRVSEGRQVGLDDAKNREEFDIMAANVDKATMDQMMELQHRTQELRRHLAQISAQLQSAETERAILSLSLKHIEQLPADARTFKPVGKMFVLEGKDKLKEQLGAATKKSLEDSTQKTTLRQQFAAKLRENESQADELIMQVGGKSSSPPPLPDFYSQWLLLAPCRSKRPTRTHLQSKTVSNFCRSHSSNLSSSGHSSGG